MSLMRKKIAILGSTGSIGTQALEVIEANTDSFQLEVITGLNNADLLIQQAEKYKPSTVVIGNNEHYRKVQEALNHKDIKVFCGDEAIAQVVDSDSVDLVLVALVGFAGLLPTINALKAKKQVALANKETLVVAGELIKKIAMEEKSGIIPVDSEHSAIFQCLMGEGDNKIEKIYLTASGGPFRGKDKNYLKKVTKEQALVHPNWEMGCKITIDSATLMNKGLEVIEAKWLFDLKPDQIEVIVHPQSIIHSMVQFEDGSIKAQMGLPDMRLPINYALSFPRRLKSGFPRFDFARYPSLTFEQPDLKNFRNLALAFKALEKGGNMPCILNAANEVAVSSFLKEKIAFTGMSEVIESCMNHVNHVKNPSLDELLLTDKETRKRAKEIIQG